MNRTEIVSRVARRSGVDGAVCSEVIDALEKVLEESLARRGGFVAALRYVGRLAVGLVSRRKSD